MGQVFSQDINPNTGGALDPPIIFQNAVTPDQQGSFASWEHLYGPHEILGANMSNLYAIYNFSAASTRDDPISGFAGIQVDPLTQLFETQNILVVRLLIFLPYRESENLLNM